MAARGAVLTDFVWALQILAAAQFFVTGLDKLGDAPPMIQLFETVGFGQWLRYFTGALEVVSAALLLVPSVAAAGAALLGMTMIGALIAHATVLPFSPVKAIILLVMVSAVFWVRRRDLRV
ncbi:MAG TPA: DoxX family protein [Vicinamibacterales bacterium]|nr:DoxX family protein [Vicinamibacterales bacterium]